MHSSHSPAGKTQPESLTFSAAVPCPRVAHLYQTRTNPMFPNWPQSNLPREVLQEKYLKISFSQNGEDDFIRSHFWSDILAGHQGSYLDIGCFSVTLYSNTKLLSLSGWCGIAVDANPDLERPWLQARPRDHFLNRCIAPSGSKTEGLGFFRFQDGAMSTANPERAQQLIHEGWGLQDRVQVPAITLSDLAEHTHRLGLDNIDVISIDLEMVDFLDDLPNFLQLLQPRLLCMECVTQGVELKTLFSCRETYLLDTAGYKPVSLIGGNIFAVPAQTAELVTVFG